MNNFKRILYVVCVVVLCVFVLGGFSFKNSGAFTQRNFYDIERKYETREVGACAFGAVKSYMDYRAITNTSSRQYRFIRNYMEVDKTTGFLHDEDGFIGVALGSYYGVIGSRYYFTLDSGVTLPVVKIDEKDDRDTDASGCYHLYDSSVIEFVIDSDIANSYYGHYGNGLVLQGNFANYPLFRGNIVKVEEVLEEENPEHVSYGVYSEKDEGYSPFVYGSGY